MAHIEFSCPTGTGRNGKLVVNGQDISDSVFAVEFRSAVDAVNSVVIHAYAHKLNLDGEFPGDLVVHHVGSSRLTWAECKKAIREIIFQVLSNCDERDGVKADWIADEVASFIYTEFGLKPDEPAKSQ